MELPLYQYHSLQPGYIRLLQFLPDGISRMRHVNLKNRSSHVGYAALSYTWGASTETFPFQCDAQNLPVRENLLHALSQLKNQIDTPIWIDAMCINQSDEVEKMSQLQMMTDIYRSANKVLIWLGKEIPEIKGTVEQLCSFTALLKALKPPVREVDSIVSLTFTTGIRHLFGCPWWPRLWVLQEATLAREAIFVCGTQLIPWKVLSELAIEIKRLDLYSLFRGHDRQLEFCDGFTEILNINVVRHTHSTTLGTDLIRVCRQRICFDPCDRVYGTIGLMDPYFREGFTWEPGEKVEDLYPPFVSMLLAEDTTAMLLSLTDTAQRNPKLPSWCPDLHYRSTANVLADHEGYHAGFNVQTTTKFDWKGYQRDSTRLRTMGIIADTLKTISDIEWTDEQDADIPGERVRDSVQQRNLVQLQSYAAVAENFVKVDDLWRIFIGNIIGNQNSKLHWLAGFSLIHDRLASRRWKTEADRYRTAFQEFQAWLPEIGEPSLAIQMYLKRVRRVALGRKLFTTKGGRVGFGPRSMTVGDAVCIVKGAKVPFVFRQHPELPNTYYLKGEAYVHGLMHGEYLKVNRNFYWLSLV